MIRERTAFTEVHWRRQMRGHWPVCTLCSNNRTWCTWADGFERNCLAMEEALNESVSAVDPGSMR